MRSGSVVRLKTTGEIGIVISQCEGFINVLCEDYKVYPIKIENVLKTGRYFDLSIIWEVVKHEDQGNRNRM